MRRIEADAWMTISVMSKDGDPIGRTSPDHDPLFEVDERQLNQRRTPPILRSYWA